MEKKKGYYKYLVPECFIDSNCAASWLQEKGISLPHKHVDELYYLLHTIRVKSFDVEKSQDGWVRLMGDLISDITGNKTRYLTIRQGLEDDGFIVVNHKDWSRAQKKSKGYKLGHKLMDSKWHYTKASGDATQRLIKYHESKMMPVDYELQKMLSHLRLPLDEMAEQQDYSLRYDYSLQTIDFEFRKFYWLASRQQFQAYNHSYWRIKEQDDTYDIGNFGRRHNVVTNMPKKYRKLLFAEIAGKRYNLKQVDIRNSQVLLLLTVVGKRLQSDDYFTFKDDVETGEFYQRLASTINGRFGNVAESEQDRSRFKKEFFARYLYGDNKSKYVHRSAIYKAFSSRYPTVHKIIDDYKLKHGYAALAQKMQKIESSIIIKEVCSRLIFIKKCKAEFVAQVYDSVIVNEEHAQTAKCLIEQAFAKRNIRVSVSIT